MAVPVPVAINDVIRVVYFQQLFGQRINTVLHMRCTVAPAGGTTYAQAMQNLAARLSDETKSPLVDWLPLVGSQLFFDNVRAQRVYPTRDIYMQSLITLEGTNANGATMPNAAMSIEKRTLHPGRHGVGRIQMGGVPASNIEAGLFTGGYIPLAQAAWESLLGDQTVAADSSKYRYILFHGAAPTDDDELFDVVVQSDVRTMHRRTLRVGE